MSEAGLAANLEAHETLRDVRPVVCSCCGGEGCFQSVDRVKVCRECGGKGVVVTIREQYV